MTNLVEPVGVDHVAINVPDVPGGDRLLHREDGPRAEPHAARLRFPGAWLDTASGQQVHLIEAEVPKNVGQHFALVFDDIEAAVAALRARGMQVSDPVPVGTTGRQQAFTIDPWGNGIELHQRTP